MRYRKPSLDPELQHTDEEIYIMKVKMLNSMLQQLQRIYNEESERRTEKPVKLITYQRMN